MAYLKEADRQFPVLVLDVQQLLLFWHFSGEHGLGRGITAMPSMHVGLAFLFFLAMRHQGRIAAWAFGAFFVVIALASVHLGYHYAVDGYVSMALTGAIWWAAKRLVGQPHGTQLADLRRWWPAGRRPDGPATAGAGQ
ncbi:MAG TPA: phosphatase PAP2 family protein [Novosphingobium sp.]|nr:phosphatase PAP2 family protein [Novosphingobium sp.]